MTQDTYDVGLVGCGNTGYAHMRSYRENERTKVAAVAELNETTRNEFVEEFGISTAYETHTDMFAAENLDTVSVCTLHDTHAPIMIAAAENGVDGVWCEKPMATSLGETRDMLDAVKRNGTKLSICHKRRFHPVHEKARDLLADGAIGEPQFVTGGENGGLLNWGTHIIDLTRFLLGDPDLAWVMGMVERQTDRYERGLAIEDRSVGQICFADGTRMTYESDTPAPETTASAIHITGSDGNMEVDLDSSVTVTNESGTETYQPQLKHQNMYASCLNAHVDWLDGDIDRHHSTGLEGYSVMEIIMGIYESARTNSLVRPPIQTRSNPLSVMIEEGDITVEKPGPYDIRKPYGSVRKDTQ